MGATTEIPTMVLKRPPIDFQHQPDRETPEDVESAASGEITFKLAKFLKDDESSVIGTKMIERAQALGNMADRSHVELFLANQKDIPIEWRKFVLVFAGAIKHGPRGYLGVTYLWWCDVSQQWILFFHWLGWGFGDRCRLVCLEK